MNDPIGLLLGLYNATWRHLHLSMALPFDTRPLEERVRIALETIPDPELRTAMLAVHAAMKTLRVIEPTLRDVD